MKMKNILISLSLLFVFTVSVFAEENIFGVLTETYKGLIINKGYAVNNADFSTGCWGTGGGWEIDIENANWVNSVEGKKINYCIAGYTGISFTNGPKDMSSFSGGRLYFSLHVSPTADEITEGFDINDYVNSNNNCIKVVNRNTDDTANQDNIINFYSNKIIRIDEGATEANNKGIYKGTGETDDISWRGWHRYYINLSDFGLKSAVANSYKIVCPFVIVSSHTVYIDNVYWAKSGYDTEGSRASFSAKLKNISDNTEAGSLTWHSDGTERNTLFTAGGWKVAKQYIELDNEKAITNWNSSYIRIYVDNGGNADNIRAGLYAQSGNINSVLQMCWRPIKVAIPDSGLNFGTGKYSFSIARKDGGWYELFDKEWAESINKPNDPQTYHWIYMKEDRNKADSILNDTDIRYTKIWDCNEGLRENTGSFSVGNGNTFSGIKIYLGADFTDALPLEYTANIYLEYVIE